MKQDLGPVREPQYRRSERKAQGCDTRANHAIVWLVFGRDYLFETVGFGVIVTETLGVYSLLVLRIRLTTKRSYQNCLTLSLRRTSTTTLPEHEQEMENMQQIASTSKRWRACSTS